MQVRLPGETFPSAISGSLRRRHRQPSGKGSRSLTGHPMQASMSTDAEAHRLDGSGSSNWTRAQGPVVSPHILHSHPALFRQRPGFQANARSECTTFNSMGCEDEPAWQDCASRLWRQPECILLISASSLDCWLDVASDFDLS